MKKSIKDVCLLVLFLCWAYTVQAQEVMPLYDGEVPDARPADDQEYAENNGEILAKVSLPTLTAFLPAKEKANGTAVIICPGGGYEVLVIQREGYKVAKAFNELGVAAFVLKYRLPSPKTMQDQSIGPLQDAQQAIKTVRQQAAAWNIHPDKIGIMGFSAGGHLASTAGTHFNKAYIANKEETSLRPDFMLLVYPVISLSKALAHQGSKDHLLGSKPTKQQVRLFSNELQVTPDTPPTLLLHAEDDDVVNVANSIRFFEALKAVSVPAGLHIYPDGRHGFPTGAAAKDWFNQCRLWMEQRGLLDKRI